MTRITVYDYDEERIERICEEKGLTEWELIELLLDEYENGVMTIFDD